MRGIRTDVQGLRAVAVGAVVLDHAGIPGVAGGYVGVDVFFVISGFLITGQLLRRLEGGGRVGFGDFYARRARRILPGSLTVLALTVLGVLAFVPPTLRARTMLDALAVAAYAPNYVFAVRGTDYLTDTSPSVFQHYWSLGVEEQFYLLWPALLALTWLLWRRRRAAGVVMLVVAGGSLAASLVLTQLSQPWAFFALPSRAWELAVGGLLAVGAPMVRRRLPRAAAPVLGWAGLAAIVAACVGFDADTTFPGTAALLPVLGAAAVVGAGCVPAPAGPVLVLGLRPLQFLGLISYALYLVHWPLLQLTQAAVGYQHPLPLAVTAGLGVLAVPLAWVLFRFVEDPLRHARVFTGARPRRTLFAALGGSATLAAACAVALVLVSTAVPRTQRTVADAALTVPVQATPFVPANLKPPLTKAQDDNPALYAQGCELHYAQSEPHPCSFGPDDAPTVMLWGDSAAAQWAPGLQEAVLTSGDRLVTQTKSACASTLIDHIRAGNAFPACDSWRQKVLDEIAANPPAVLVLANYDNDEVPKGEDAEDAWEKGLSDTIAHIPSSTRIVLLSDSPDFKVSPVDCLSQHVDDADTCAQPASVALRSPGRVAVMRTAAQTRAELIDLTPYFCADTCPAIIGDTLVYRDSHHLTASYSTKLAQPLKSRLAPLLP